MKSINYEEYYRSVISDFKELKENYPYCSLFMAPTTVPSFARVSVIAANKYLVQECEATKNDFEGSFSKKLEIIIPFDYKTRGCEVYGGNWIKVDKIPYKDRHFFEKKDELLKLCVGVPQSFSKLKNVLLENVRTAENMLIAYESYLRNYTDSIELIAYSHGEEGKNEYDRKRKKFRSK